MHKSLLALLGSSEPVVGNDWVVRQVGACREHARRGEGERTGVVADYSILTIELYWGLGTGRE